MTLIANGQWEVAGDADWFAAELTAGLSYIVELIGEGGQVLRLADARGTPALDLAGNGALHFTAGTDGLAYFSAMGLVPGGYAVRITQVADDYADNASSTGRIVDGKARGMLEHAGDSDWFQANLVAGRAYQYSVATKGECEVRIIGPDGNPVLLPPPGADGRGTFVPDASGKYEIVIVASGNAETFTPAAYTVRVERIAHSDDWGHTPETAGTITLGGGPLPSGAAAGNWEVVGDRDWFAVEMKADRSYKIAADAGDGLIWIVDASGAPVGYPATTVAGTSFTPPADGTYFVQMQSFAGTGAYGVTVAEIVDDYTNSAARAGTIAVGGSVNATFEANNDADWFEVELVAGQSYSASAVAGSRTGIFAQAGFVDAEGNPLGQTMTATRTGTHYVQALGIAAMPLTRGGGYTMSVASYADDFADNAATRGTIAVGGSVAGKIETMFDADWFKVTLEAGKSYAFAASGNFAPPLLELRDATGAVVSATGAYTPARDGTYYVVATGLFPGGYRVSVDEYADDYGESAATAGDLVDVGGAGDGVTLSGSEAVDRLVGDARGDWLLGQEGNDELIGRGGDDVLDGGSGADRMSGGTGNDAYVVDDRRDRVIETAGGGNDKVVASISYTLGSEVEDLRLTGGDALTGTGNALANRLSGNDGANRLDGAAGNDWLHGGAGRDVLTGGSGADRFHFDDGDTAAKIDLADRITDFSRADGDLIDLSAIDSVRRSASDDAFVFVGGNAFSGTAGELRVAVIGADTFVQADVDGDARADLMIRLDGAHALTAADFVL